MMEGDGDDCTQEMDRVLLLHGVPVGSELAAAGGNLPGQGAAPIGSGQAAAAEQGLRRGHPDGAEAAVGRAAAAFGRGQPIAAEEGTLGRGATAFGRGDAAGVEGAVARGTATIGRSQVAAVDGGMGLGTAAFCRGLTAGVARSYGRCAAALGRGLVTARFGASAATTGRGQMSASGHQSSSPAAGAIQAGRAQFAGTLHHDATLEAASDAGVYGLGGSGNGSNVEDGPLDGAVRYYREGDEGYVPPFDATDEQYYSLCLDMNGDTSRGRNHGRGLGRSRGFTLPRQARSAVARGRGRGRSRGRGLTTSVNEVQPIVSAGQNANAVVVNGSTSQRSAKNPIDSQGDSMDWSVPEHVSIVCSLFAEQVQKGNRPNTHLNAVGLCRGVF
ncbi:hypothetical protein BS78_06G071600 [Paspalum vaginatum]|nr:hypothetical protein BS78_06G071600 [Paspalum vaginatum]